MPLGQPTIALFFLLNLSFSLPFKKLTEKLTKPLFPKKV